MILVIASLIFFGWSNLNFLPLLVIIILMNYFFGLMLGKLIKFKTQLYSRLIMWIAVIVNLGLLGFFKYLNFFDGILVSVTPIQIEISEKILPLGISYFTFSNISYILDIFRGLEKSEKNILRFSAFLIMFPKLMQGPITRFKEVKKELESNVLKFDNLAFGARRFIVGMAKKVLIADPLGLAANKVFNSNFTLIGADIAWLGLIAYTLQIYFDFSGYTDMAIGLGQMLGLKLPENFNFPYISKSIADFWRRWHMTLTSWFRTYVFIPLEFARKKQVVLRQASNIFIVFMLTGLWHGANWNFIIWGSYFGLILAFESGKFGKWLKKIPVFLQHFYALILIMIGWVFFRLTDIGDWLPFISTLFGGNGITGLENLRSMNLIIYIPIIVLGCLFSVPFFEPLIKKVNQKLGWWRISSDLVIIAIFLLSITYVLSNGFQTFLYTQF
jgi:alginate O-acetyltransferase complex protein AlgI